MAVLLHFELHVGRRLDRVLDVRPEQAHVLFGALHAVHRHSGIWVHSDVYVAALAVGEGYDVVQHRAGAAGLVGCALVERLRGARPFRPGSLGELPGRCLAIGPRTGEVVAREYLFERGERRFFHKDLGDAGSHAQPLVGAIALLGLQRVGVRTLDGASAAGTRS